MRLALFQRGSPTASIPVAFQQNLIAVTLSASSSNEKNVFVAHEPVNLLAIRLIVETVLTGAAAGAIGFFNLWRNGVQVGLDGALGGVNLAAVGGNYAVAARTSYLHTYLQGFGWTGTAAAVTAGNTAATLTAVGSSVLTSIITATSVLIVDPGLPTQESITCSALNTGTGAITCSAFANNHPAGALYVIAGAPLWQGTTTVTTVGGTGGTLTSAGASVLTAFLFGAPSSTLLTFEPGSPREETIPISTINTGTGVYVLAGTFGFVHAAGSPVVVRNQNNALKRGDVISFKWTQLGTGLALPQTLVSTDYAISGSPPR